jgi:hypothetical protein
MTKAKKQKMSIYTCTEKELDDVYRNMLAAGVSTLREVNWKSESNSVMNDFVRVILKAASAINDMGLSEENRIHQLHPEYDCVLGFTEVMHVLATAFMCVVLDYDSEKWSPLSHLGYTCLAFSSAAEFMSHVSSLIFTQESIEDSCVRFDGHAEKYWDIKKKSVF